MNTRPTFPSGLYGVTPDWDDLAQLSHAIEAAARGGLKVLQWRHKTYPVTKRISMAHQILRVCRLNGVLLIINDNWRVAEAVGADGVHLGRDDDSPTAARAALGAEALIGASCYNDLERAKTLLDQGADYIAFGAMYPSQTKPHAVVADPALLTQARDLITARGSHAKVVAIGGITADNAPPLIAAGADSLAVVGGLFMATDIEATARAFGRAFEQNADSARSTKEDK
jgi:thiamine-phosphate pyrophosphorylase